MMQTLEYSLFNIFNELCPKSITNEKRAQILSEAAGIYHDTSIRTASTGNIQHDEGKAISSILEAIELYSDTNKVYSNVYDNYLDRMAEMLYKNEEDTFDVNITGTNMQFASKSENYMNKMNVMDDEYLDNLLEEYDTEYDSDEADLEKNYVYHTPNHPQHRSDSQSSN